MRFLRHLFRLVGEFIGFAWHNKVWWIVPIVLVLFLMAALLLVTEVTLPWAYPFF